MGLVRYIWCPGCVSKLEASTPPRRRIRRTIRSGGRVGWDGMVCDRCNRPLPMGTVAAAVSMYDHAGDYRPWEDEYLLFEEDESE